MEALAAEAVPAADQEEVFGFMGQMGEFHRTEPHWYLPILGVDVTKQRRGYGSRCYVMRSNAATGIDCLPTSTLRDR